MKLVHVSLLVTLLTACEEEPFAPVPRLPRAPIEGGPVVITGRVVSSVSAIGIQAANVRVIDAEASVGTDDAGRYTIVLPASFRGQIVPVQVRAIGFKAQNRTVALTSDTVAVDVPIALDAFHLTCVMQIVVRTNGASDEPASAASVAKVGRRVGAKVIAK